jgi:DHA2 family multidrug resistance protein-like MFS transporter
MFRDPRQRAAAIAIWATSLSAGGALGPVAGGLLLEHFWWGSVFLIPIPVMALLLLAGPVVLPEARDPGRRNLDITSVTLGLASVLAVIYGIKQLGQGGAAWPAGAAIACGLLAAAAFLRRQARLADPLIDLELFRRPAIALALAANTLGFFLVLGITLLADQQLQLVVGLSPLRTGLATLPMFAVFITGALASPALAARARPAIMVATGFLIAAIGLAILTAAPAGTGGLWTIVAGLIMLAAGLAPVFPLVPSLVLDAVPVGKAGASSALSETSTEFGGALGIALLGIIGAIAYRASLTRLLPRTTPPDITAAVKSSLGAARAAAAHTPSPLAAQITHAAQASFTSGLHAAALAGVTVALAVTMVTGVRLRGMPRNPGNQSRQEDPA